MNIAPEILKSYGNALATALYQEILNSMNGTSLPILSFDPCGWRIRGSSAYGVTVGSEVHSAWVTSIYNSYFRAYPE